MLKKHHTSWIIAAIALALAVVTMLVYLPVRHHELLNWDDLTYIPNNDHVKGGITWNGVAWSFTHSYSANWCPLTWISYMIGCQFYGLSSGGHHMTNAALHAINTALLLLLLRRLTSSIWRSAFVAALFGLHPLHVESVAWIAERKDVLSTFFFFLTLLAYGRYTNSQLQTLETAKGTKHGKRIKNLFYLLALLLFTCGLMSKPMLVTLPFVLLLIDYWPLGRFAASRERLEEPQLVAADVRRQTRSSSAGSPPPHVGGYESKPNPKTLLFLEKLPFFALSAACCVITVITQKEAGAVASFQTIPLTVRLENAAVAYVQYLAKFFWPANLSPLYPHVHWTALQVGGSVALLLLVTALAWIGRSRFPYLLAGWFWFLGTLVPVIGIIQVGSQAFADRYTYIPLIGVMMAVTWLLSDVIQTLRVRTHSTASLESTPREMGGGGTGPYQESARSSRPWNLVPGVCSFFILGLLAWRTSGQLHYWQNTETLFARVLEFAPDSVQALYALGTNLIDAGKVEEGKKLVERAIALQPGYSEALGTLANTLDGEGKYEEAIRFYNAALKAAPDNPGVLNNLAWLRASCPDPAFRDGRQAVLLAARACDLTGYTRPLFIGTLAAAQAEAGDFPSAIVTAERAAALATSLRLEDIAARNRELISLYRQGKAAHGGLPK